MRGMMLLAAIAGLFAATTTAAGAETPPAAAPAAQPAAAVDPVKLALARELIEATGGRKAVEARLKASFGQVGEMMKSFATEKTEAMTTGMLDDMQADMAAYVPQILDITAEAYARNYSEQELRDYLAWLKSPSGQSIIAKGPAVQHEVLQATTPMMQTMVGGFVKRAFDRACAANGCTPEQRQKLDAIMRQMGQPK